MRFDTELEVQLSNLKYNIQHLRDDFLRHNQIIFMVKANAYGHGLSEIAAYAHTECGINNFGVATLAEAIHLRNSFPKMNFSLWVFSEINMQDKELSRAYHELNIYPVIGRFQDLKTLLADHAEVPIVLKFNTGMNRLGIDIDRVDDVITILKKNKINQIHHLMTHFSSSYIKLKHNDRTHKQYEAFCEIKEKFAKAGIGIHGTSVSNSGAIEQKFGLEESHVRPGLMLYGPRSLANGPWMGKIISSLRSSVIRIREIKRGTPVGYGGHICHADGHIVYLPIGYGDGLLTYYSGLEIKHKEFSGKFIGRVNMDIAQIYFEKLPTGLDQGSVLSVWDETQGSIDRIVSHTKTIPYQLFTSITSRVSRRYYS